MGIKNDKHSIKHTRQQKRDNLKLSNSEFCDRVKYASC